MNYKKVNKQVQKVSLLKIKSERVASSIVEPLKPKITPRGGVTNQEWQNTKR
jgi:hypothetical protein